MSRITNQYPWKISKLKKSLQKRKWFRIKFNSKLLKSRKFFRKKFLKTYENKTKFLFKKYFSPGITNTQFKKLFKFKNRFRSTFRQILKLELRLDTLILRNYFLPNIGIARFCIQNDFFLVNNKNKLTVNKIISIGDVIELKSKTLWSFFNIHYLRVITSLQKYYQRLLFKLSYPFFPKRKKKLFKEDRWSKKKAMRYFRKRIGKRFLVLRRKLKKRYKSFRLDPIAKKIYVFSRFLRVKPLKRRKKLYFIKKRYKISNIVFLKKKLYFKKYKFKKKKLKIKIKLKRKKKKTTFLSTFKTVQLKKYIHNLNFLKKKKIKMKKILKKRLKVKKKNLFKNIKKKIKKFKKKIKLKKKLIVHRSKKALDPNIPLKQRIRLKLTPGYLLNKIKNKIIYKKKGKKNSKPKAKNLFLGKFKSIKLQKIWRKSLKNLNKNLKTNIITKKNIKDSLRICKKKRFKKKKSKVAQLSLKLFMLRFSSRTLKKFKKIKTINVFKQFFLMKKLKKFAVIRLFKLCKNTNKKLLVIYKNTINYKKSRVGKSKANNIKKNKIKNTPKRPRKKKKRKNKKYLKIKLKKKKKIKTSSRNKRKYLKMKSKNKKKIKTSAQKKKKRKNKKYLKIKLIKYRFYPFLKLSGFCEQRFRLKKHTYKLKIKKDNILKIKNKFFANLKKRFFFKFAKNKANLLKKKITKKMKLKKVSFSKTKKKTLNFFKKRKTKKKTLNLLKKKKTLKFFKKRKNLKKIKLKKIKKYFWILKKKKRKYRRNYFIKKRKKKRAFWYKRRWVRFYWQKRRINKKIFYFIEFRKKFNNVFNQFKKIKNQTFSLYKPLRVKNFYGVDSMIIEKYKKKYDSIKKVNSYKKKSELFCLLNKLLLNTKNKKQLLNKLGGLQTIPFFLKNLKKLIFKLSKKESNLNSLFNRVRIKKILKNNPITLKKIIKFNKKVSLSKKITINKLQLNLVFDFHLILKWYGFFNIIQKKNISYKKSLQMFCKIKRKYIKVSGCFRKFNKAPIEFIFKKSKTSKIQIEYKKINLILKYRPRPNYFIEFNYNTLAFTIVNDFDFLDFPYRTLFDFRTISHFYSR